MSAVELFYRSTREAIVRGSIESPTVKHVVKDPSAGITYEVMAYRQLTDREIYISIANYVSQRKRKPAKGSRVVIMTIFGVTPRL